MARRPGCRMRGERSYRAGLAAEDSVARDYARRGHALVAQRWRGKSGEIDLIMKDGDDFIMVEVKQSQSFDRALQNLSRRQLSRICRASEEFAAQQPSGSLGGMRVDVALVDGMGAVQIVQNVTAYL